MGLTFTPLELAFELAHRGAPGGCVSVYQFLMQGLYVLDILHLS